MKRDIRFIDSFKFMAISLDSLVNNLSNESFRCLTNCYQRERLNYLNENSVYPYDYIDGFEKLSDKKLPSIESFYFKLNYSYISEAHYRTLNKSGEALVWRRYEVILICILRLMYYCLQKFSRISVMFA